MEWLALLIGIGIISSLFDKKSNGSSHPTKATTRQKTNEWDSEIQGKGIASGSGWGQIRKAVLTRDNYTCRSCRRKDNLTVDHIVQLSKGGTNSMENLQTLCKYCHEKKDNRKIFDKSFNHDSNYGSRTTSNPTVQAIERAIRGHTRIRITYTDINQRITYREITPSHFTKEHGIAYLVAFCHLRNEKRTFRLSRVLLR